MLGLPAQIRGCLFDMDGVLTETATVHSRAWKEMFDAFLKDRAQAGGEDFRPFDDSDYTKYVDGRPRYDGVRAFLESRDITLPEGTPEDDPKLETVDALGNRKNDLVQRLIREDGVQAFAGSVRFVEAVREAGLATAVVSSSANTEEVLRAAAIAELFSVRVDGNTIASEHLKGKPAPDSFLAAARAQELAPAQAAVFEDALSGVQAGRAGAFGYVVGVDRVGQAAELRAHGADIVVGDLAELLDAP